MSTYITSNIDIIFNSCSREGNKENEHFYNDTFDSIFNNGNSEGNNENNL